MSTAAHRHLHEISDALDRFAPQAELASAWGRTLGPVLLDGGRLLAAGNGGSAAQAQHLTAELVGRFESERRALSAVCLTSETSTLTALINDYPSDQLYARQVAAHGRPGDVCVLLSTSGRSRNILAAAEQARRSGLLVWALTGSLPNPLASAAHEVIAVPAARTSTVQELHLVALHVMCAGVDEVVRSAAPAPVAGELVAP